MLKKIYKYVIRSRMPFLKKIFLYMEKILRPKRKNDFIFKLDNKFSTKVLDVGCGNNSPKEFKMIADKIYYVGIDVGNYNQSSDSIEYANEYHIVTSDKFAEKIEQYNSYFDAVICSHNLEHCDEPDRVLKAISNALKEGGKLYIAFPCEESVNFPHRYGTLNFYDDSTHNICPDWSKTIKTLQSNGIEILFMKKNYSPIFIKLIGKINESKSKKNNNVLLGTWEYYGFESIIWGKKIVKRG